MRYTTAQLDQLASNTTADPKDCAAVVLPLVYDLQDARARIATLEAALQAEKERAEKAEATVEALKMAAGLAMRDAIFWQDQLAALRLALDPLLQSYEDYSPPMLDRDDVEKILRAAGMLEAGQ